MTKAQKLRYLRDSAGGRKAASVAARLAVDREWEVRVRAFEFLRTHGDRRSLPLAVSALADVEDVVVASAIECIVEWGGARYTKSLARLLDSPSELVRSYAAWSLGQLGDARHIGVLQKRFRAARSAIEGSAAAEALFALTRRRCYLNHLIGQLKSRDPEVRAFTSNSLVGVVNAKNFPEVLCSLAHALAVERNTVVLETLRRDIGAALADGLDAIEARRS